MKKHDVLCEIPVDSLWDLPHSNFISVDLVKHYCSINLFIFKLS